VNYDELASLVSSMPRIPKREMWCHPVVVMQLREETWWQPFSRSGLWRMYDLLACPVYEDPSMDFGAWEIREDGEVTASGNTAAR
jgi:hypothetical protein